MSRRFTQDALVALEAAEVQAVRLQRELRAAPDAPTRAALRKQLDALDGEIQKQTATYWGFGPAVRARQGVRHA